MNFDDFKALFGLTFRDPQAAARALMGLGMPVPTRWMALALAVSVSSLLAWLAARLLGGATQVEAVVLTAQPLLMAALQFGAIALAAFLMAGVGRVFGGQGRFEDALLLTVWIEIVLLVVQLAQIAVSLVLPSVGGILGLLAIGVFMWLTVQFTKALHGFHSGAKVLLGVIATAIFAGFVLSLVAASLGIMPEITP